MEKEKADLVFHDERIEANTIKIFNYVHSKTKPLTLISLDEDNLDDYNLDEYARQSVCADLFCSTSLSRCLAEFSSISPNPLCIANKDLVINQHLLEKMKNEKNTDKRDDGYVFSIYGNATIDENITCDFLFVNGDLTINATRVDVSCLLVTGKLIANNSHLTLGNFYVGKTLIAKQISLTKSPPIFFKFCIVIGDCLLELFEYTTRHPDSFSHLTLCIYGNFKCKELNLTGTLRTSQECKIEKLIKNHTFLFGEDLEVDSPIDLEGSCSINCHNLTANSSVNVCSCIHCSGDFVAHGNVKANEIAVDGNYTVIDGITEAKEVKIRGEIHAKEIDTFNLKTYRHFF